MNVTKQNVRRRGSSLEESALKSSLNFGLLKQAHEQGKLQLNQSVDYESDDEKQVTKSLIHVSARPEGVPRRLSNVVVLHPLKAPIDASIDDDFPSISARNLLFLVLLAGLLGFASRAFVYIMVEHVDVPKYIEPTDASLDEEASTLSVTEVMDRRCLKNSTYCPQFSRVTFARDWSTRTSSTTAKPTCYKEHLEFDNRCTANCELLFRKSEHPTLSISRIITACKVGCMYSKREKEEMSSSLTAPNCQFDCRNTVWVALPGKARKCNYDKGLGLLTTEYEKKYGTGVFGAGKACEVGCVLGNSRVCPQCDLDADLLMY